MKSKEMVLVTGAPGWLGNRLVETLCERGRKVRCFVLNGMDASYLRKLGAEIFYGDLKENESVKGVGKNVETVFHCAAVEHTLRTKECYKVNVEGTRNLIEECVESGVNKFIYVSSSAAQGRNLDRNTPMTEKDECKPYSAYGKSKYLAENIVRDFHNSGKIKTVIIRPIWFYGPCLPEKTIFLVRMIKTGKPLMFGKGDALKSMTYIDNVVNALFLAEKQKVAEGKTYLIADKKVYTVKELYEEMAKNLGVELNSRFLPLILSRIFERLDMIMNKMGFHVGKIFSAGEISRDVFYSIEKAERELGYKPKIGLKEGMKKTIEWCRENEVL